jgi:bis(5'-adenosyl)-triphosphatase
MALYNIAPVLPGHVLVIPRAHHTSLLSLTETEMTAFFEVSRMVLKIVLKAFGTDAFDWSIQEKPEAGQTLEHLHLHIVPRKRNDLPEAGDWYPLVHQNDDDIIDSRSRPRLHVKDLHTIVEKLKETARSLPGNGAGPMPDEGIRMA